MTPLESFLRRRRVAAALFLIFSALAIGRVLSRPVYLAEALIAVEEKKGPTTAASQSLEATQLLGLVRSHVHLLQSPAMLKSVVRDLRLDKRAERTMPKEPSDEDAQAAVARLKRGKVVISSPPFTNLIEVRAKNRDPKLATAIANALVRDYLQWSAKFERDEADRLLAYLNAETAAARKRLTAAEARLNRYKNEHGVTDLSEEIRARFQLVPERFRAHYEVIRAQETKLLELGVERSRLRELYTDESPQIHYLDLTIEEVKRGLSEKLRQTDLEGNLLEGLERIPEEQMVLGRLTREAKAQESLYLFLLDESAKARLLKAKETLDTVRVVSWADLPARPHGRMKSFAFGVFAAAFLAVAGALASDVVLPRQK